jgi:hypothetical protein
MEINIPNKSGLCKNCLRLRKPGSAYCGICNSGDKRQSVYLDEQKRFPRLEEAKKIFEITPSVLFTYRNTIYSNYFVPYDLITHETTHIMQQKEFGGADKWWNKYFKDKEFRLSQEIEAYGRQYMVVKANDIAKASILLDKISDYLSGKLYGNLTTKKKAKNEILLTTI